MAGLARSGMNRVTEETGGPARARVVAVLALVLALNAADQGAVGAIAEQLERGLHIGNWQIGLMVTISALVAAVATVPMGALIDRLPRVRLLWISIAAWAVAEALGGLAPNYWFLVGTRILLGAATATAGPAVASLSGDLIPPSDRGRIWGFILTGEVVGTGLGVVYAGMFGSALGWRAAFFAMVVPSLFTAFAVRRFLPEPARGGQSRLAEGATEIPSAEEVETDPEAFEVDDVGEELRDSRAREIVAERGIEPAEPIVLSTDPAKLSLWQATLYVLRVRTNWVMIVAGSLGYFFLAGLETFAIIFLRGQYGLSHGTATLIVIVIGGGIVAGVLVAGHLGDRWMRQGHLERRITIGVVGFIVAAAVLAPAIAMTSILVALPLFLIAAFAMAAPNPGLDAARLDVVPAGMWGRSEGVRTLFRQSLQGLAPLTFGLVSELFGASSAGLGAGVAGNNSHAAVPPYQAHALEYTFLVMLVPLLVGGVVLLLARRAYPVDVASALESERRLAPDEGDGAASGQITEEHGRRDERQVRQGLGEVAEEVAG